MDPKPTDDPEASPRFDPGIVDTLLALRGELAVLEGLITRLEDERARVSPMIWERVHGDYGARRDAVRERARPLEERAESDRARVQAQLADSERTVEALRLEREELELRHRVGELSPADLATRRAPLDERIRGEESKLATLHEASRRLSALDGEPAASAGSAPASDAAAAVAARAAAEVPVPAVAPTAKAPEPAVPPPEVVAAPPPPPAPAAPRARPTPNDATIAAMPAPELPPAPPAAAAETSKPAVNEEPAPAPMPEPAPAPATPPAVPVATVAPAAPAPPIEAAPIAVAPPPPPPPPPPPAPAAPPEPPKAAAPAASSARPPMPPVPGGPTGKTVSVPAAAPSSDESTIALTSDGVPAPLVAEATPVDATRVFRHAVLVSERPIGGRTELPVEPLTTIGRTKQNQVQIDQSAVSRRHAEIALSKDGYRLRDLGSGNGTFVNGQPVVEHLLRDGDRIVIGTFALVFKQP